MIKISACVIVKNEEKCIGRWLDSVAGFADEIIVVDTGSEDKTVELVKNHVCNVNLYNFAWKGDFSAAKNYALTKAKGNWIVFLDADEYFSASSVVKLRSIVARLNPDIRICGVMCRLVNIDTEQNDKFIGATVQVRIFRNTHRLRYQGKVHEALTIPKGKSVELVKELEIIHTGYNSGIVRKKLERNLNLLKEKIRENNGIVAPRDYRYLMDCYYGLEEYDRALEYAELALHKAEEVKDTKDHIYMIKVSACLFGKKTYSVVTAAFDEAIKACPQVADFLVMKGIYLYEQKNYLEAEQAIREGILQHDKYQLSPASVADNFERFLPNAYMVLGDIMDMKGNRVEAEHFFVQGLEKYPYQVCMLRKLVVNLYADGLSDDDIIVFLNHIYDKKKDGRFLTDSLKGALSGKVYLYYLRQCDTQNLDDEIESYMAAKRYDAVCILMSERLDWLYKRGIKAAIALNLPEDNVLQVFLPERYRQQWQEEVRHNG